MKATNKSLQEQLSKANKEIERLYGVVKTIEKESSEYPWEMVLIDKNNDWTDTAKPLTNKQKEILEIVADIEKNSLLNPIYLVNKCRFIIHPKFELKPF